MEMTYGSDEIDERVILLLLAAFIVCYNNCRNRSYLTRSAILHSKLSPWAKVFHGADDNSFLEMTGMTRSSFGVLKSILFPRDNNVVRRGRPPLLDSFDSDYYALLFQVGERQ